MEKEKQLNTFYTGVSSLESRILSAVSDSGLVVFGVQEIQRLTALSRNSVNNTLFSLTEKGLVVRLLRNRYVVKEKLFEEPFAVATNLFLPSYISFWTALAFYGFTEQQPAVIQLACTKQFKKISLNEIKIQPVTIKPKNFFGYQREEKFSIASKEKALIDSALHPASCGGFKEFIKCLKNSWSELNKEKLVEYLERINNKSVNSRMGYLIESMNLPIKPSSLKRIQQYSSKGFVKLNPEKKKTKEHSNKWRIIINDLIQEVS